jgi:2-hydroxychromene-2-carboxylate isomerase
MNHADINFYFDPLCPFAWMTSKWVRQVTAQRDYTVDWRFISLRMINADVDYDSRFPAGYQAGHTAGLRLLRVAARTRAEYGPATRPIRDRFSQRLACYRRGGRAERLASCWTGPRRPPRWRECWRRCGAG